MMHRQRWIYVCVFALVVAGCDDDEGNTNPQDTSGASSGDLVDDAADTSGNTATDATQDTADGDDPQPDPRFAFGLDPAQTLSKGPFPSNLYLGADGRVDLASVAADPVVGALGDAALLATYDGHIAQRQGFGYAAPALFFLGSAPAEASLAGKARIITLSGPEAGREVAAQAFWAPHTKAVGVLAAWGDYMMPDSTYAVLLGDGITLEDGTALEPSEGFGDVLATAEPVGASPEVLKAREVYAPLRAWMQDNAVSAEDFLVATVFDTEPVVTYAAQAFDAVDAFALKPVTARVRYDKDAQAFIESVPAVGPSELDALMGVPEAPFAFLPGHWEGSRERAAQVPEGNTTPYAGGSLHVRIGAVYNGSIEAPAFNFTESADGQSATNTALRFEGGLATHDVATLIPFTLYLCEGHLADPSNLPVAVFSHGGGVTRLDALAMANLNCASGVATVAIDMAFHGARSQYTYLPAEGLVVPTGADTINGYTGKTASDLGYQPDFISEGAGATGSVGQLLAVESSLDPLVVEANLLTVSTDTHLLVRYLREGDWSGVATVTFNPDLIFHQSLSFGTSLTTALHALRDDFAGIVTSVGTGMVLQNIAMAPSNAQAASTLAWLTLGLKSSPTELQAASYKDFMMGLHFWLHDRADPLGFAPYVLRHRLDAANLSIISTGNSWDETLHNSLQLTYAAAVGLKNYHDGGDWQLDPTVPGADTIAAERLNATDTLTTNVTYDGRSHTAVNFFHATSCHAQLIANFCVESFEHPYPPVTPRAAPAVVVSHSCEIHHQAKGLMDSLLGGSRLGVVAAPAGDCETLYTLTP